jgi:hypothetical protein
VINFLLIFALMGRVDESFPADSTISVEINDAEGYREKPPDAVLEDQKP